MTSISFNLSTYSTILLSCSASSFFSSSATSNTASFATYSTAASLIFIRKDDLRDPRHRPWFVHSGQKFPFHFHQLLPPDLIRNIYYNPRALESNDCNHARKLRTCK